MTRPLRVLVVEDEVLIADYIAILLEDAGHEVVGICDCADPALTFLRETRPDLAILDIRINGNVDGVDLALRMQAEGLTTKHLFITGSGDPETKARALATGPIAILQKPVNVSQLEAILATVAAMPSGAPS